MKNKACLIFFSLLTSSRTPSLAMATNHNDYSNIKCPSQSEFDKRITDLNFSTLPDGELCDLSRKGKLARILSIADELKVDVPDSWKGGANEALQNPLSYIDKMTSFIDVDLSQTNTVAYNSDSAMFLGPIFFNDDPLESLVTLIHEARHSSPNDPGHVRCLQGDIPYNDGGCDQRFSTDNDAGSYAYQVSFSYGLARLSKKLSESDKIYLKDSALSTIGTRFNRVPSFLSTPHEVLIVLDEKGKIFEVDPFIGTLIPRQSWVENKKVVRVEFNQGNNGIWAWTEEGYVYSAGQNESGVLFGKSFDKRNPIQVLDINHMATGSSSSKYFITKDHEIRYNDYEPSTGEYVSKPSKYQATDFTPTRIILSADSNQRLVLDDQGRLHRMDDSAFVLSDFQPPFGKKWQHVYRSLIYQNVYGLDRGGALFFYDSNGNISESPFQPSTFPFKVIEGTSIRGFLNLDNTLEYRFVYDKKDTPPHEYTIRSKSKIVDAAFMRRYSVAETFLNKKINPKFIETCNIKKALTNPWTDRAMGLSKENKLIFEGLDSNLCVTYPLQLKLDDLSIGAEDPQDNPTIGYSSSFIILTSGKNKIEIRPYVE